VRVTRTVFAGDRNRIIYDVGEVSAAHQDITDK
jgi:hypothetical protein